MVIKKWLRNNIFHSKVTVNGRACKIVIDGGSCENIISQALLDRLKLNVPKHYCPYFARWLMTGDEVQVRHACPVTFAIGEDYTDTIWCAVLPIESGDILLGRPWIYDKNGTNGMHDNTYTFAHNGKHVRLHPMKLAPPKKGSSS